MTIQKKETNAFHQNKFSRVISLEGEKKKQASLCLQVPSQKIQMPYRLQSYNENDIIEEDSCDLVLFTKKAVIKYSFKMQLSQIVLI